MAEEVYESGLGFNVIQEFLSDRNKKFIYLRILERFDEANPNPPNTPERAKYFCLRVFDQLDEMRNDWKPLEYFRLPRQHTHAAFEDMNEMFIAEKVQYIQENINYFQPPVSNDGDDSWHMNWLLRHDRYASPYNGMNHGRKSDLYYTEESYNRPAYRYCNRIDKGHRDRIHYRWYDRDEGFNEGLERTRELGTINHSTYNMEPLKRKKQLQESNEFQYY